MLTPQQEKFAQSVALEDMTYTAAYRSAYNTSRMSDKTANEKASRLAAEGKIRARIDELRATLVSPKIMTAKERLEWLTEVIKDENESTKNRLSASDQMNKMQGEYLTRIEGEVKMKKLEDLL